MCLFHIQAVKRLFMFPYLTYYNTIKITFQIHLLFPFIIKKINFNII